MENVKNLEKTMLYFYFRNQIQNSFYTNALLYSYFQSQNRPFSSIFPNFNFNFNQNLPNNNFIFNNSKSSNNLSSNSSNLDPFSNVKLEQFGLDSSYMKEKRIFDQQTSPSNTKIDLINSKQHRSNSIFSNEEGRLKEENERKYKCRHKNCELGFKTIRQSTMHHNKFEPECKAERNAIVKVIGKYKVLLKKLVKKYGINKEKLSEIEKFQKLEKKMEDIKLNLADPEFFSFIVGDKVLEEEM